MIGLGPRHAHIAERGKRCAAAGLFASCPAKSRVEIIAAVHEDGAGIDLAADPCRRLWVARPQGNGQAEIGIVHQLDRLGVGRYFHDADDGAETFIAHHPHGVIHVDEDLRCQIGAVAGIGREKSRIDQCRRPRFDRFADLGADLVGKPDIRHWSERRFRIQRIAELVGFNEGLGLFDKGVEQAVVDIDALDAAAALTRIEHRPVKERVDGGIEIGVGTDISRVLAAEFEADGREGAGGSPLDAEDAFSSGG